MRGHPAGSPRPGLSAALLLIGVLLLAANLRAVLTVVGPVLPMIGADRGMGPTELGMLVSLPVLAFGLVSLTVHRLARRHGVEHSVLVALLLLLAGAVVRSLPGELALWTGTAMAGAGIAVGNVLLPVVVRQDFPSRVAPVTGYYIAAQSVVAGAASGLAVPLAGLTGSWEVATGLWALPVLLALGSWLPRLADRGGPPPAPVPAAAARVEPVADPAVWRSRLAWQVAAYFGLQSTAFYVLVNWLPTVEQDLGVSATRAGWHLSVLLAVGIVSNLAAPFLMRVGKDQRVAAVTTPALTLFAAVGLALAPELVGFWVALLGMALGGSMVIALSLISLRSPDPVAGSRLSSMVQSVGYLGVAAGLVVAGLVRDVMGPGDELLFYVAIIAVVQLVVGLRVGRDRVLVAAGTRPV